MPCMAHGVLRNTGAHPGAPSVALLVDGCQAGPVGGLLSGSQHRARCRLHCPPRPCSPLFQLMRGRPRALPHRRRAGNPRRHPRESHSGCGHSGQGGRSTRSRRPDSGGGDARPLGTPQWVHSGRACATVTRARRRAGRRGLGATGLCSTAACWGVASAGLRLYRGEWYGLTPRRRDRCLTVPAGEAGCAAATAAWATCSRWDQHRDTAGCVSVQRSGR